ncbi:LPS export ABC transporter periplasmic protein LptC [Parabacteroides sp. OttesenSCG-928-G06]|nr:LPS export ABC transporter periplasmic protein LptC [Parabacteroides sp. OttesenSCG-928-K15]MDL2282057.1 LPS export ABC transporter periplasmic protein LptC [Parabacteroides sp. OttesenSCG-928-G06]
MTQERFTRKTNHKSITTTLGVVVMLLLISFYPSCTRDKGDVVEVAFDPDNTYTMRTTEISSLISDSGITRYRVESKEMLVFDKAGEPYWHFPQGLYIEQFDTLFNVQASIKADTAYHWYNKNLWKAIGNVVVVNLEGDRFETDSLWWDMEAERIYSDAYMHVQEVDGVDMQGIGFSSSQDMTDWVIRRPLGAIPFKENKAVDSTSVEFAPPSVVGQDVIMEGEEPREEPREEPQSAEIQKESATLLIQEDE